MGELGLAEVPKSIFVRKNLLANISSESELQAFVNAIEMTRKASPKQVSHNLDNWNKLFLRDTAFNKRVTKWPLLAVPHIGDSQRKIRDELDADTCVLIIEPTIALETSRDRSSAIAIGCAFTLMSPPKFDLRWIGHRF